MDKIKACIFDLDGTLTDTIRAIAHFGNLALGTFGLKPLPVEDYKIYVGDGRDKLIHRILNACGADNDDMFVRVRSVYDENYEKDYLYDTDAYDGIREMLEALRTAGVKIAVCSNKPDNVVHYVVNTIFGEGTFDEVSGIVDGKPTKPDPRTALEIAERLGAKPSECLFLGDTNVDIFTAKNAGMNSAGVLWGFRSREELETAGADYIVETPEEILDLVK